MSENHYTNIGLRERAKWAWNRTPVLSSGWKRQIIGGIAVGLLTLSGLKMWGQPRAAWDELIALVMAAIGAGAVIGVEFCWRLATARGDILNSQLRNANDKIDALTEEIERLSGPLDLYIDPETYGTISPEVDGHGYSRELRLWNVKLVNNSDRVMHLRFAVRLLIQGYTSTGKWIKGPRTIRNHYRSIWWQDEEREPVGRKFVLGPGEPSPDGMWVVFALPKGEESEASRDYTSMHDNATLVITDDISERVAEKRFRIWLDDWPPLDLNAPPERRNSEQSEPPFEEGESPECD